MKARVDENCTGCGLCEDVCPEVFELGDDGIAKVIADPIPETFEDACREAEEACPVDAIVLED